MGRSIRLLALLATVLSLPVQALTREEILASARSYTNISWSIADTAYALHDKPLHRYWHTAAGGRHSPLVEWIIDQGGDWDGMYVGAPYATGARMSPQEGIAWVAGDCAKAIGLSAEQWAWRFANNALPWCFAGISDCSGMAGYATEWSRWRSVGTTEMMNDAIAGLYYERLCDLRTGDCDNTDWARWEVPKEGDLLVKPGSHVYVFTWGTAQATGVIECTGLPEYERCVERTLPQSYADLLTGGYRPISVKALVDTPATVFLDVQAASRGIVWKTLFLRRTWGFAVEWSADANVWDQIGDYLLVDEPNEEGIVGFAWTGPVPEDGYVRVVEIETDSQRKTVSRPVVLSRS